MGGLWGKSEPLADENCLGKVEENLGLQKKNMAKALDSKLCARSEDSLRTVTGPYAGKDWAQQGHNKAKPGSYIPPPCI